MASESLIQGQQKKGLFASDSKQTNKKGNDPDHGGKAK
jgi:hypothetical protein